MLDHELDLSGLDARFCNDLTGAPAYPPATLLKLILFAYSCGIISSREIERACQENVVFIRTSHLTTGIEIERSVRSSVEQWAACR